MALNDPYAAYRRQVQITRNVTAQEQSGEAAVAAEATATEPRTERKLEVVRTENQTVPPIATAAATAAYSGRSPVQYLETRVMSATPAELTLMLFDGAIRFMSQYLVFVEAKDIQAAHNSIVRAQDIFSELLITLDMKKEISDSMASLYVYFIERLTSANVKKEADPVHEVIELTREMRGTWIEAMKLSKVEKPPTQPGGVNIIGG